MRETRNIPQIAGFIFAWTVTNYLRSFLFEFVWFYYFIRSEISPTSIVIIYLDENGMLASSLMIDMNEKSRDPWLEAVEKAQVMRFDNNNYK